MARGKFIISFDFELYWGLRDVMPLNECKDDILSVWSAIPSLLELFDEYKIHVTWATVGFIFFVNKNSLLKGIPAIIPAYSNPSLSPYNDINTIGQDEKDDPFHYAPSLIKKIVSYPNQEIATHTFSHFCCLEKGQDEYAFRDDIKAAIDVVQKNNLAIKSIVFPLNQINNKYLPICKEFGINAYRGNPSSWIYNGRSREEDRLMRRFLRVIDAYLNISGHNTYSLDGSSQELPINIPASRFLGYYRNGFDFFEPLRLKRILSDMEHAARNNMAYHIWSHPRNFGKGKDMEKNMLFLRKILDYFIILNKKYGMESINMQEAASRLLNG